MLSLPQWPVPEEEMVSMVTREGDIVTVGVHTNEVDIVGTIEDGIQAVSWSPGTTMAPLLSSTHSRPSFIDYEIVIFVTAAASVISMTRNWDVLTEFPLFPPKVKDFFRAWETC